MDFFIGLMVGLLIGGFVGIGIAALISANGRYEEDTSGVDDVLDEIAERSKDRR